MVAFPKGRLLSALRSLACQAKAFFERRPPET